MADSFDQFDLFDQRLQRIGQQRQNLSNGYQAVVASDGLVTLKPKRRKRELPVKGLVLLLIGFFAFKGLMLAHLGPQSYDDRVGKLGAGTVIEQAGAWVMQNDVATDWIAKQIGPFLR